MLYIIKLNPSVLSDLSLYKGRQIIDYVLLPVGKRRYQSYTLMSSFPEGEPVPQILREEPRPPQFCGAGSGGGFKFYPDVNCK